MVRQAKLGRLLSWLMVHGALRWSDAMVVVLILAGVMVLGFVWFFLVQYVLLRVRVYRWRKLRKIGKQTTRKE